MMTQGNRYTAYVRMHCPSDKRDSLQRPIKRRSICKSTLRRRRRRKSSTHGRRRAPLRAAHWMPPGPGPAVLMSLSSALPKSSPWPLPKLRQPLLLLWSPQPVTRSENRCTPCRSLRPQMGVVTRLAATARRCAAGR
jgi:hypothetical protein